MDKILGMALYLRERFSEPSTKKVLAIFIAWMCVKFGMPELQETIGDAGQLAGVALGAVGFFVKEAKPLTEVK